MKVKLCELKYSFPDEVTNEMGNDILVPIKIRTLYNGENSVCSCESYKKIYLTVAEPPEKTSE